MPWVEKITCDKDPNKALLFAIIQYVRDIEKTEEIHIPYLCQVCSTREHGSRKRLMKVNSVKDLGAIAKKLDTPWAVSEQRRTKISGIV